MRAVRLALVPALLLGLAAGAARAVSLEQIQSPRPAGWVVDQTGTLAGEALAELNRLGDDVKGWAGSEIVVVVVNSTDGVDSHEFATRLFNTWGIANDGVLVFAALEDHKAEIVLGDAALSETARQQSEIVMNVEMVPRFRTGDPAGAIVAGARGCARRILQVPPGILGRAAFQVAPPPSPAAAPLRPSDSWIAWVWILGAVALATVLTVRFRPVRCPKCGEKMRILGEVEDNAYLDENERLEENLGSIDHKIWVCLACGELKKDSSVRWLSGYRSCPRCAVRALKVDSWTVEEATYDHGGRVRTDESCAKCSYHNSYTRSTPRRVRTESPSYSSSSASAFRSSSSSSSSSSSGSSRSSSGGGGHSSGGGASGSW